MQREGWLYNHLSLTHTIVSINWAVANLVRVNSENASTNEPTPCNGRKTRLRKSISWWNCGAWWSKLEPRMMPRLLLQRLTLIQILVWISLCPNTRTRTGDAPHDARTRTQRSTDYQPIIWNLALYYESENHTVTPLKLLFKRF